MLEKGLYPIYKNKGMSSYDVIRKMKKNIPKKEKIGYAGTLDYLAEGLLVVAIGRQYTKKLTDITSMEKTYYFQINLSGTTISDDEEYPVSPVTYDKIPTKEDIERVLKTQIGEQMQVPSSFSAKKVKVGNGGGSVRAYSLARKGEKVKLKANKVTIYSLKLVDFSFPIAQLKIVCSKGTYVRTDQ